MKIIVNCTNCHAEIERWPSQVKNKKRYFCNKQCDSEFNTGENNPNFNNKWSSIKKEEQSKIIKSKVDNEYREKAGTANRGKKFSKERINKMHGHRTKESYSRIPSQETRRKIGEKSKLKFTPEYNKKIRKKYEELGIWTPLELIEDKKIYFKSSNWIDRMFDLITDPVQLKLLEEKKVFHSKKNSKGIVRDHIFSRNTGFANKVFPEILRHPCNLQLLTHSENIKKKKTRYLDSDGMTLCELFFKIRNYEGKWKEHNLVLSLIERYENGERWSR
jgi:hypothetical protein